MKRDKVDEISLVLTTGFLLISVVSQIKIFLILALSFGIIGIFIKPLARLIANGWIKLGELMGLVVSKIILTIVFFTFLLPIAMLYRVFKKDRMNLKKSDQTYWIKRFHTFSSSDFDHIW